MQLKPNDILKILAELNSVVKSLSSLIQRLEKKIHKPNEDY